MTPPSTRLDRLVLRHFRLFEQLDLLLHPNLNVIVAPNGSGKTAVLDAIALAWAAFVHPLEGRQQAQGISGNDIRRQRAADGTMEVLAPVTLEASVHVEDIPLTWHRTLPSVKPRTRTRGGGEARKHAEPLKGRVISFAKGQTTDPPVLPVFAYYGTGRLWDLLRLRKKSTQDATRNSRFDGYHLALTSSSHVRTFVDWFGRFSRQAVRDSLSSEPSPHRAAERLKAVGAAVDVLLAATGWHGIEWDDTEEVIFAHHPVHGRLPVELLSDGIRNMIGLVADLAHRAARLNPQLGERATLDTPGVVLIDEVDMHLHPEWQQTVVESLRTAFPLVQFILTTHSPQVLSTVARESIRVLHVDGDGTARATTPGFQTRGVESADVLAQIMGVNPTPHVLEAMWVNDYKAKIQQGEGESPEALALREKVVRHFEANHPVVLECDRMLRFQTFKRSRNLFGAGDAKD